MSNDLVPRANDNDWSALAAVTEPHRVKVIQEMLSGETGYASVDAWRSIRLNNRELACLTMSGAFDEYVLSRLAAGILGIDHMDRSQLATVKLFLDYKTRFGKPTGPVVIDAE